MCEIKLRANVYGVMGGKPRLEYVAALVEEDDGGEVTFTGEAPMAALSALHQYLSDLWGGGR